MTTTAFDDQFTTAPEHVTHQPYDVTAILRQNVADLERELLRQRERADNAIAEAREDLQSFIDSRDAWMARAGKAEAELKAAREQEPVKYLYRVIDCFGHDVLRDDPKGATILEKIPLYARPIPAPAPAVPEITDEALREQMNGAVILATDEDGVTDGTKVMRGFAKRVLMTWGNQEGMYKAFRDAVTAPDVPDDQFRGVTKMIVPDDWREVMAELAADLQACIEAEHAYRDQYSSVMRKYQNDMRIVERARALLQSAGENHD